MKEVDTSRLDVDTKINKGFIHRDYLAHLLRWNFVLRFIKINSVMLDVGCADGQLAHFISVNRVKPALYVGVDINNHQLKNFKKRQLTFKPELIQMDIRKKKIPCPDNSFDIVCCFEVIEHFEKKYINFPLKEMKRILKADGMLLLSTPNYDGKHRAAGHIYEYTETELEGILNKHFIIEKKYGTFASQTDIKSVLNECEKKLFDCLKEYYYSHMLAIIFASLYPSVSRNILWVLKNL